jgi:hypothetical protein
MNCATRFSGLIHSLNDEEDRRNGGLTDYGEGYFNPPDTTGNARPGPKSSDTPRQLGYRRPDPTTVVTWCTYHRSYRGNQPERAKNDLVLFLNGSVKPVDSYEMSQFPYHMRP